MKQSTNGPHLRTYILWVLVFYIFFTVCMTASNFGASADPKEIWAARGQFGDQFGALNTLFTGIGSALLLYTIITQGKQIEEQQTDIKRQLKIAEANTEALRAQHTELARAAKANELQVLATICQARISAIQARIDAAKILAAKADSIPENKTHARNTEELAKQIDNLASILDNKVNKVFWPQPGQNQPESETPG